MIKKTTKLRDLPFIEGKIYPTKFATGEMFLIKEIIWIDSKVNNASIKKMHQFKGVYQNSPHLGVCPLSIDRLIPETEFDCEIEVCSKCNEPVKK